MWKSFFLRASEIVLDAEIRAERFYDTIGFDFRPPYGYLLKQLAKMVCNGRTIFVLEGGYSIRGIRECGLRVFQELADLPTLSPENARKLPLVFWHGYGQFFKNLGNDPRRER